MDDDEFGSDADFLAALAASEVSSLSKPNKPIQPTPQKLDKPPNTPAPSKVIQPTPQALPPRSSGSSIQVSTRQNGNPILAHIRTIPWEYADIPADYALGQTTCALFLSLKYHLIHPDYIYKRIRNLQGKYNLRILLTMVDIANSDASIKELSKTSLINNVTVILCWSAAEAGRYLELYKSYEYANPSAIKSHQSTRYTDKLVEFITVPRSITKTDAVSIVGAFGSIKGAVNAMPEEVAVVAGWGEKKVRKWCEAVQEPFRARKATKRGTDGGPAGLEEGQERPHRALDAARPLSRVPVHETSTATNTVDNGMGKPSRDSIGEPNEDEEDVLIAVAVEEQFQKKRPGRTDDELSEGVAAALAKLRQT